MKTHPLSSITHMRKMLFVIFVMAATSALQYATRLLLSIDDGSDGDGKRYLISLVSIQGMDEWTSSCEVSVIEGYVVREIGDVKQLRLPHCTDGVQVYILEVNRRKWREENRRGGQGSDTKTSQLKISHFAVSNSLKEWVSR